MLARFYLCAGKRLPRDMSLEVIFAIGSLGIDFLFGDPPGIDGLLESLSLVACLAIVFDPFD